MHFKLVKQSESSKQVTKLILLQVLVVISQAKFDSVSQIAGEEAHALPSTDLLTNSHDLVLSL